LKTKTSLTQKLLWGIVAALITVVLTSAPNANAATTPITAIFNFDAGTPALNARQPTPFNQTVNGVTASFGSPTDFPSNPAFSVQNLASLATSSVVINSTYFSGLFLWPSTVSRDTLFINFSQSITNITLNFKTAELHDPGPGGTGSPIRLTAYANSTSNQVGSPVTVYGNETLFDTYPEGVLAFNSTQPFNIVKVDLPFITQGASGFIIDNVTVTTSTDVIPEFPVSPVTAIAVLATLGVVASYVFSKQRKNLLIPQN
jgi:hypothetical protein